MNSYAVHIVFGIEISNESHASMNLIQLINENEGNLCEWQNAGGRERKWERATEVEIERFSMIGK